MSGEYDRWLVFAHEDFRMAELALQEEIFNQACFHSQQAAEKALKGLIMLQGGAPPRTHRLIDLLSLVMSASLAEFSTDIQLLDRFYIPTRYPDALPGSLPDSMPIRDDAEEAMATARRVLEAVESARNDVNTKPLDQEQQEMGLEDPATVTVDSPDRSEQSQSEKPNE